MNIVMIGPFGLRRKGTVAARALPIAWALAGRGHRVTVLVPPWDEPGDAGQEWEENGVRVVNVGLPPRCPLVFHILLTLRLVRRALAWRPDVVHCFKPKAYAGLAHFVLWWLRRLGMTSRALRLVVDEDDWERAWNQVEAYSPAQKRFFAWQERWGLRHADVVVVASRALARLTQGEGVPPSRIVYVPNGVWPGMFDRTAARPQAVRMLWELGDAPVILLYSRFFEFRLARVVAIMRRVVAQEPRVRLLVVGEGLFAEEAEMDDMLNDAGLGAHAVFTGWGQHDQLMDYFATADLAIFPYDDTLINRAKCSAKLVELLAAGVPVVADAIGQNKEYILDNESGLLIDAQDDLAFADAVLRLLKDGALRARLGATAARRVQECFEWPQLVTKVEGTYRR